MGKEQEMNGKVQDAGSKAWGQEEARFFNCRNCGEKVHKTCGKPKERGRGGGIRECTEREKERKK